MRTTLKQLIRVGLRSLGYDLRRLPEHHPGTGTALRTSQSTPHGEHGGWCLEFMGPSGVGKTTLYNELVRRREKEDTWQTATEFLQGSIQLIVEADDLTPEYEPLLQLELADICRSNEPSTHSFRTISKRYRIVVRDAKIRRSRRGHSVVSDGLLCDYFPTSLIKLCDEEPDVFDTLNRERAIINCVSSPEAITRQIRQREKLWVMRLHRDLDDRQLTEYNTRSLALRADLVSRLIDRNIPCLTLNTIEDITENAQRIRDFIRTLECEA